MAEFLINSCSPLFSSFSASLLSSTKVIAIYPVSTVRFPLKSIDLYSSSHRGLSFHIPFVPMRRGTMIAQASTEIRGTGPDGGESESESDDDEYFLSDKIPLDSKLQQKLEQKMRMKLTKRIRLRRKKLVRKRRMRKKGQWPPSKQTN